MPSLIIIFAVIAAGLSAHESVLSMNKNARLLSQPGLTKCSEKENSMAAESVAVEYRPIPGFPKFRAGSDGSIWSSNGRDGKGIWKRVGSRMQNGYIEVSLGRRDGKRLRDYAHRLVLLAFVGPCPPGMEARHFPDPDPSNCRLSNLRWDTHKSNCDDTITHGTRSCGELHTASVLTDAQALQARIDFANGGIQVQQLAAKYGVARGTMASLLKGETWKHVGGPLAIGNLSPKKLSDDDVVTIRRDFRRLGARVIADLYGIAIQTAYHIASGRKRSSVKEKNCA